MLKFGDEVWVMFRPREQDAHLVEGTIINGDEATYIVRYRDFTETHNIYRGIFWHDQVFPKGTPFDEYLLKLTKLNGEGLNGSIASWLWLERNTFLKGNEGLEKGQSG